MEKGMDMVNFFFTKLIKFIKEDLKIIYLKAKEKLQVIMDILLKENFWQD
jgi:hypothetical protein